MTKIGRRSVLAGGGAAIGGLIASPARSESRSDPVVWVFDNLNRVGGYSVERIGAPKLITSPWGPAVKFDGKQDGLFIPNHPLSGASTFTFEALFRPDGGTFEQRWFHLESSEIPPVEPGKGNTRMLFELRVIENSWYLDAFATGAGYRQALMAPEKTFPIGQWYHVAQTFDGSVYRSFVNGELQTEKEMAFAPQGPGTASVGVRMNRVAFFNGAIQQARFTHTHLNPSEFHRINLG
jgi:hypothetical protein